MDGMDGKDGWSESLRHGKPPTWDFHDLQHTSGLDGCESGESHKTWIASRVAAQAPVGLDRGFSWSCTWSTNVCRPIDTTIWSCNSEECDILGDLCCLGKKSS